MAGVDHTYENVATTFPDGRVATCAACEADHDQAFWEKLVKGRAADVSFVLDQPTGPRPKWEGARLIDPHRIAMAGHSVGGAGTTAAMLAAPGYAPASTSTAPPRSRSPTAAWRGRSCSWAGSPRTPREAEGRSAPGSATGDT
ncbi:hypothetical protein [Streptomyces scabiei]|uniref:hypothetical protein n=1 Tax=Streptomyces scabiei TaxID=1930 RepID=UPI0029B36F0D|nr:hypothetical protein [Streptomyces scabiei]MDX3521508.1 hypothetical protein [Streptomyces scabiei]